MQKKEHYTAELRKKLAKADVGAILLRLLMPTVMGQTNNILRCYLQFASALRAQAEKILSSKCKSMSGEMGETLAGRYSSYRVSVGLQGNMRSLRNFCCGRIPKKDHNENLRNFHTILGANPGKS